jgi:hypothetical protein
MFVNEYPNTVKQRKYNGIGQDVRRNCLLKHVIEGNIEGRKEVTGRRGIILKQLLNDLKEKRGYWELKEEILVCTVCRTSFGRGCGPLVRQTTGNINGCSLIENKLPNQRKMARGAQICPHYGTLFLERT